MDYSVLMSVYHKENPDFLKRSIDSVMEQTVVPNDFVIVCDGLLTEELDLVLNESQKKHPCINILRKEKNEGLGLALSYGILNTKNEIVMRMDSDDVCLKDRAEIQLPLMEQYDVVGGFISEFSETEDNILGYRCVPEDYKCIIKFAKKRCPFNHPSVMFKKSAIIEAGNYQSLLYFEDYYLWVRLLPTNDKVYNVQKVLVNMRSGLNMRKRRGGKEYRKSLRTLRKYMLTSKFITRFEYIMFSIGQLLFSITPSFIKDKIYLSLLRKQKIDKNS